MLKRILLLVAFVPGLAQAQLEELRPLDGVEVGNINYVEAAAERHPALEQVVVRQFGVPSGETVRYRYNRVSLDGKKNHLIVMLVGPRFSGSGGSTGAVFIEQEDGLTLLSQHSLFRSPVVKLPTQTEGWSELALPVAGGGAKARYARLSFEKGTYPSNPSMAQALEPGALLEGTAYLADSPSLEKALSFTAP